MNEIPKCDHLASSRHFHHRVLYDLMIETFRFEDENDYQYEILLEYFSPILKI